MQVKLIYNSRNQHSGCPLWGVVGRGKHWLETGKGNFLRPWKCSDLANGYFGIYGYKNLLNYSLKICVFQGSKIYLRKKKKRESDSKAPSLISMHKT